MEHPQRAQSVLTYQRSSQIQFRASKFVHKIATRVLTFKKRDSHDSLPYMSRQSMDVTKPYMSQPMINLHAGGPSTDGNDSSRSGSPCTVAPEPLLARHAISSGLVPGIQAGVVVGGRGVSIDLGEDQHRRFRDTEPQASPDATPLSNSAPRILVSQATPPPRLKHMKDTITERISLDSPSGPPRQSQDGNAQIRLPTRKSTEISGLPATSSSLDQVSQPSTSRPNPARLPPNPAQLPPSISRRATPPRLDPLPSQALQQPSQALQPDMRQSDAQATSVPARSTRAANIPSSFARMPSGAARLSPSVLTSYRSPPVLRLPVLPPPTPSPPDDAVGRRARSEALRGVMPQLSLQGGSHENDNDGDDSSSDSDEGEDDDETEREPSRRSASSSTESFHSALQSARTSRFSTHPPALPEIDSSALDVSFDDAPNVKVARVEPMKTPTSRGARTAQEGDYFSIEAHCPSSRDADRTPGSPLRTPRPRDTQMPFALTNMKPMPPLPTPGGDGRPTIYKHASRSMIDIMPRSQTPEEVPQPKAKVSPRPTTAVGKTRPGRRQTKTNVIGKDAPSLPSSTPAVQQEKKPVAPPIPTYEAANGLRRRRSMPTFSGAGSEPPPYPSYPFPHPHHRPQPHEDEGREPLPAYKNDVYLKAIMPRKMEFSKPGVQARDRKWRRVMCVLEGTMFRVYDCPKEISGVGTLEDWWERKVGVGDIAIGQPGATAAGATANGGTAQVSVANAPTASQAPPPAKIEEGGSGPATARLTVPVAPPPTSFQQPLQPAATRSRLNIVGRLRSRSHGRSVSDVSHMANPPPVPSRSSLSIASGVANANGITTSPSDTESRTSTSPSHLSVGGVPSSASSASNVSTRSSRRSSFLSGSRSGGQNPKAVPDPSPSDLIKMYTLQHAESGLGNDYFKRKNVIRVRMEGEQFLLQAKDISEVVEWIEGLQAAANIALDLDERPMPRGPLFPRRRRRRGPRRPAEAGGENQNTNTNNPPRSPPLI